LDVPGTAGNAIEGNDVSSNQGNGIVIEAAAGNNRVGGLAPAQRNSIGLNGGDGILVFGNANVIQGNYIGTTGDGRFELGNPSEATALPGAAPPARAVAPAAGNVTPANTDGARAAAAADNQLLNNFIGTDATGTRALPNGAGVFLAESSTGTLIAGNLISGNF